MQNQLIRAGIVTAALLGGCVHMTETKPASDEELARQSQIQVQNDTSAELAATKEELAKGDLQHVQDSIKLNDERVARKVTDDKNADMERRVAASEAKNRALVAALTNLAAFKEEARGLVLTLSGGVLFVSDQAALLPTAQAKLDQIAAALISNGPQPILIEGHTDSQGDDRSNMLLSERRAESVRNYLVGRGIAPAQVRSVGLGETRPIASNESPEGRANNRRVEIIIER